MSSSHHHSHAPAQISAGRTLFGASLIERLGMAAIAILCLWAVTWWAL